MCNRNGRQHRCLKIEPIHQYQRDTDCLLQTIQSWPLFSDQLTCFWCTFTVILDIYGQTLTWCAERGMQSGVANGRNGRDKQIVGSVSNFGVLCKYSINEEYCLKTFFLLSILISYFILIPNFTWLFTWKVHVFHTDS